MAEIHKCGHGWAYCDGNCTTCAARNYCTTNGTITFVKDYPPYLDYPKQRKKQTNADKIRQMSDEELVDIWYFIYQNVLFAYTNSRQGLLDWLKQEVSDD